MSFQLTCPNCGLREVGEFRYGGEILDMPPGALTSGGNLPGKQTERWYHLFGCRRWLKVERDVRTNQVHAVSWLSGPHADTAKEGEPEDKPEL